MKTLFICFLFLLTGCATVPPPQAISNNHSVEVRCPDDKHLQASDNFDKAGDAIATGSRWIWNESLKAYEWATSEENKKKMQNAWKELRENLK